MPTEKKSKKIYRLAPCPAYDVERIESWLQDMAMDGWLLSEEDGIFFGWFTFEQQAPQKVRYRIEPWTKKAESEPPADALALYEAYGWKFVAGFDKFYIFRADRSDARELNTDPQVQAAALKHLKRDAFWNIFSFLIIWSNALRSTLVQPARFLISFGMLYTLIFLGLMIWFLSEVFVKAIHFRSMQKKLKQNIPLDHNKPWKKSANFHRFIKVFSVVAMVLFICIAFTQCTNAVDDKIPIEAFPEDPPFVTLQDLSPEGTYVTGNFLDTYNKVTPWSTLLAPENYEWFEYGEVTTPKGDILSGALIVRYHRLAFPWLAKALADDYLKDAGTERHFQLLDPPDVDADYVIAYRSTYPAVIIQKDNLLIYGIVGVENIADENQMDLWLELTMDRLA